jgi:diguanylate cyclase (GGDEF)-like protein
LAEPPSRLYRLLEGWRQRLMVRLAGHDWVRRESAERRIRAVLECATEGILLCNRQGDVLLANKAAALVLGETPAGLLGRNVSRRNHREVEAPDGFALKSGDNLALDGKDLQRPLEIRVATLGTGPGRQWLVYLRDVADRKQTQEQLSYLANFDSLTGLPNRVLFRDRLGQAMSRSQRTGRPMALMFLDLDRFKLVNDSLGHEAGDKLLQHVAQTLTACLRNADSVARQAEDRPFTLSRLGGDEFTIIAEAIAGSEDATLIARRMLEALNVPFKMGDDEVVVSASIGISMYPNDDVDLDTLIRHTDMAMYRSKSMGRATYSFFSDDLNAAISARLTLERGLRRAMENSEFHLHYQPKASLATNEVTGVEALIRWHCPGQGMVPPDRFISVLEDTGMILPVGAWVIRAACAQLAAWDKAGLPQLRMAVNLSARQFKHLYLASLVEDSLRENAIDPRRLDVELTESLLMEDTETNRGMLANFARMGVRLAIDDFGTGHSSLSYLKRFNIDTLKIDKSFVAAMPENTEDVAIATAVIALARSLDMSVVAEGVETQAQSDILRELGCDEIQGYLLSRPLPAADLASWLTQRLRNADHRRLQCSEHMDAALITVELETPG